MQGIEEKCRGGSRMIVIGHITAAIFKAAHENKARDHTAMARLFCWGWQNGWQVVRILPSLLVIT